MAVSKVFSVLTGCLVLVSIPVQAQDSVNVYGVLDTGYATRWGSGQRSASMFSTNSYLGLKGEEDLAKGLTAFFDLQMPFDVTSGRSKGALFERKAVLGLKNYAWGSMSVGRQYTVLDDLFASFDPFYQTRLSLGETLDPSVAYASDATFKYMTPDVNGFQMAWSWSGREKENGVTTRGSRSIGIHYEQSGWLASLAYQEDLSGFMHAWYLGLGYDFDVVKLTALYSKGRTPRTSLLDAVDDWQSGKTWLVGLEWRLDERQSLKFAYADTLKTQYRIQQYQVSYQQSLSKHISVYVDGDYRRMNTPHRHSTGLGVGMKYRF
ncbi:porin [Basilea psittacipulmonis]|uniref:Porin domain-containing protein n=1 Tax=Basilea psittacipulmonis DSM 24701 TaxID=1072685 RepID=A0A077DFR4_9BURK|nr:porin [Basilea psittacipulmonis]AIL33026.1 hypothetical protein IX83_06600 [Basilea psittacipulmonis DSM 24701]